MNKLMKQPILRRLLPFIVFCLGLSLTLSSSEHKCQFKNTPIKVVLKEITRQSGYTFVYSDALKELDKTITIRISQKDGRYQ